MTDHGHFQDLISEKLDRVISAADDKLLADHLASCEDCREIYELLSGARQALDFEVEAPETLLPGVMDAVRAEKNRRGIRVRRARAAAGALAAAAVLAVAVIPAAVSSRNAHGESGMVPYAMPGSSESAQAPKARESDLSGDEPAICSNPADDDGFVLPVYGGSDTCDMSLFDSYAALVWVESLPEEITQTAQSYPLADGSVGYDITAEQFEELLGSSLRVVYPDPAGTGYLAVVGAE